MSEKPMRILRVNDVLAITGLTKPTLYRYMSNGKFPRPVSLGERAVGWREEVIAEWLASRAPKEQPAEPRSKPKPPPHQEEVKPSPSVDYAALAAEGLGRVKRSGNRRGIYTELAKEWNTRGLKTQKGLVWSKDTVRRLILARGWKDLTLGRRRP
jgi:prophage regulatory protein